LKIVLSNSERPLVMMMMMKKRNLKGTRKEFGFSCAFKIKGPCPPKTKSWSIYKMQSASKIHNAKSFSVFI